MDGSCIELADQTEESCGHGGDTCESCITGEVCVEGKCVVDTGQCSPVSCPSGCCEGSVCVQPNDQSWLACGSEANSCEQCDTATVCDDGTCTDEIADGELLGIVIESVEVATTNEGEDWDPLGGAPDLYVCVTTGASEGCTTAGSDTFAVEWGSDGVLFDADGYEVLFSTDDIIQGYLWVTVYDDDVDTSDVANAGSLPPISTRSPEYTLQDPPNLMQLTFSFY